ncbi:MAG: cupin domain-containing protein [Candidatus Omnitrophota bacterium]|jgi:mannose-6-phosphate isomerase-like protein (cupin superfamily)
MFIKRLKDCPEFTSGDNCSLREILHPSKACLKLGYSLAYARVKPGRTTTKHSLKGSEVYYILEGTGIMYIDREQKRVSAGCTVYIPPKAVQCIKNTGKKALVFLCIVDPAWRARDEIVFPKGRR